MRFTLLFIWLVYLPICILLLQVQSKNSICQKPDIRFIHLRDSKNLRINTQIIDTEGYTTDMFSRWAMDYLNRREFKKEPFFTYLAYNAPHVPVQPPAT